MSTTHLYKREACAAGAALFEPTLNRDALPWDESVRVAVWSTIPHSPHSPVYLYVYRYIYLFILDDAHPPLSVMVLW